MQTIQLNAPMDMLLYFLKTKPSPQRYIEDPSFIARNFHEVTTFTQGLKYTYNRNKRLIYVSSHHKTNTHSLKESSSDLPV